jgi:fucose permease
VGNEWSALTLRDGFGAGALVAGAGPTAFAGAMLVGRLVGDRVIDRIGIEAASRVSGALVAVGAGAGLVGAAALDLPVLLVAGLVAAGIGAAVLFPSMLAVGDRLDASGTGVAVAASASRVGFLAVPVVVGTIADAVGLPVAFGLMPLAGVAVALVLPRALAGSAAAGAGRG